MAPVRTLTSVFQLPRHTLRTQLALLYAAVFAVLAAGMLQATNLLLVRQTQHGAEVHQLTTSSALVFTFAVLLSLGLGWLIAGRFLRRLRTITATARAISATNLHERLGLGGPDDEFNELGKTLDDLFIRLEASFESQQNFVANAAHELRSPLTAERALLQVALADPDATVETWRSTGNKMLKWSSQQEHLIDALLTLATSQAGVERWEPVDLADIAQRAILARREEANQQNINIGGTLNEAVATGDPRLVESLVANLADNAVRHNIAGGWVEISTTTTNDEPSISVRNSGPAIPPDEVTRLFQPFQQLGKQRTRHADGHGLGLHIVHAIAAAHGATLSAHSLPEGGLDIQVTFQARR